MQILVAIDGSEAAGLAVDLVGNIAWPAGTQILVVKAFATAAAHFDGPWPGIDPIKADQIDEAIRVEVERTVRDARDRLARPGVKVREGVLHGRPATVIVDEARSMRADLIVVGSRGHGTIEAMLLGSVSAEVVDHAPAPVLVARGSRIDRVVLAWDGSACASRAADLLLTWPIFANSAVRVVSIADGEVPWWTGLSEAGSPESMSSFVEAVDASRRQHDQFAAEMTAQLQAVGLTAEADRRAGDAASEIMAAATDSKADLIIMGTHGRTGLGRLILGSVARNVLQHAPCSVLVVHDLGR